MSHPPLLSVQDLASRLGAGSPRVLDCRYYVPGMGRDAAEEFLQARIPGSIQVDLDAISATDSPLPHMMPEPAVLAGRLGALGLQAEDSVVTVETIPGLGAMRVRLMLQAIGHRGPVQILDGGMEAWRAAGLPVESGPPLPRAPAAYRPDPALARPDLFVGLKDVQAALDWGAVQLVDVRPRERFEGSVAEPRPGLRSGHVPGARNLPFTSLFGPDRRLLPTEAVTAALAAAGIDPARPILAMCGSGVSAAALHLALEARLGRTETWIYDGSWSEWGADPALPLATGPTGEAGA